MWHESKRVSGKVTSLQSLKLGTEMEQILSFWRAKARTFLNLKQWAKKSTYTYLAILLMEEILHQLIGSLSHYFPCVIPGGAGFLASTVFLPNLQSIETCCNLTKAKWPATPCWEKVYHFWLCHMLKIRTEKQKHMVEPLTKRLKGNKKTYDLISCIHLGLASV